MLQAVKRTTRRQQLAGVRPAVWWVAGGCLLAALAVAVALNGGIRQERPDPRPAVVRKAALTRANGRDRRPTLWASPARAIEPTPRAHTPAGSPATRPMELPVPDSRGPVAMERADAPGDSRIAAEIRVLEREAARVAESLALLPQEPDDAPRDRAGEDARAQRFADALLVEHFVQDSYLGTLFPAGYPAEERTRTAAESQVRALSPEMRRDLLDIVLQSNEFPEPVGPAFAPPDSGFVWESASR